MDGRMDIWTDGWIHGYKNGLFFSFVNFLFVFRYFIMLASLEWTTILPEQHLSPGRGGRYWVTCGGGDATREGTS
jgi:hypothetical protein